MLEQKAPYATRFIFTITRYAEEPLGCGVLLPMNPSSCIDALRLFVGARFEFKSASNGKLLIPGR